MRRAFFAFLFTAIAASAAAPGIINPLGNPGFLHFYNDEFDQALASFQAQLKANPQDPTRYNYVAQAILYREMYRDGALESQLVSGSNPFLRRAKMEVSAADKAQFQSAVERAIELCQATLRADPDNVNALYALAVAHGLRANYLFLVEKSWMEALRESIAGRKANDQILKIDPAFVDAHLIHGLSEYIVGCLPGYLKLLGAMNGFHGDKEDGIRQIELVSRSEAMSRYDAAILLAAIYRRERRPKDAIPLLDNLSRTFPHNHLLRFEQVQMYSDAGDKQAALKVLAQVEHLRCTGAAGYAELPAEKIRYLRGNLLFWYGDLAAALSDLKQVTRKTNDLDLSTAVMAWLRVGQVLDLQDLHTQAVPAYEQAERVAPKSEAAAEARTYISKPYKRKQPA